MATRAGGVASCNAGMTNWRRCSLAGGHVFQAIITQGSHEKKTTALVSIESWLFDRGPYNGLFKSAHNRVVFDTGYTLNN